jgi:hypothetical protein
MIVPNNPQTLLPKYGLRKKHLSTQKETTYNRFHDHLIGLIFPSRNKYGVGSTISDSNLAETTLPPLRYPAVLKVARTDCLYAAIW